MPLGAPSPAALQGPETPSPTQPTPSKPSFSSVLANKPPPPSADVVPVLKEIPI